VRRGVGALFVAFLAVRIFLGPIGTPSQAPASAQGKTPQPSTAVRNPRSKQPAASQGASGTSSACDLSCLGSPGKGLGDTLRASLGAAETAPDLANLLQLPEGSAKNAHFLIATVPDPVHTHLSLLFDRQIVAIEEAVQQGGYLFSRAYLPWDNEQHAENPDFHVRVEERNYVDSKEGYPGVLIFHNAEQPDEPKPGSRPLLVFLVGETPTGGIEKDQFISAIEAIGVICREAKSCADPQPTGPNGHLFILGPTFSGSLYSLHSVLKSLRQAGQYSTVTIHSGTASSYSTIQWFIEQSGDIGGNHATFRTFQESSDYAVQHLLSFVCGEGYRADRMALLSEDETAYGNVLTAKPADDDLGWKKETCPNDETAKGKVLHLYFPRDISQLRNAYAQNASSSAGSSNTPPSTTLQLNLADTGNDDDSVNTFAHGQTPLSQEATMMGIVSDLREHEVNLVVLEATNALDIVFLVRYLRVAYPDARLVTINTDLLLPRQVDDPRLRGVMQVTSYSLIPEIDEYTTVGAGGQVAHLNRIFPSDYSVGTYNAALSLMTLQAKVSDSRGGTAANTSPSQNGLGQVKDLPPAPYSQYGWPTLAGKAKDEKTLLVPPLWLTILGRDQFWPINLLDGQEVTVGAGQTPSLLHAVSPDNKPQDFYHFLPAPWIAICSLSAAFGLIYALLALNGNVASPSIFQANFAPVKDASRSWMLAFSALVICEIFICLLWPISWYSGYAKLLAPLLPGAVVPIFWDLWRRGRGRYVQAVLAAVAASMPFWWWAFDEGARPLRNLMHYRYVHVTSGVSPVLPFLLLFAACLWACWQNLSGRPPWDVDGSGPPLPEKRNLVDAGGGEDVIRNQPLAALTRERNGELLKLIQPCKLPRRVILLTGIGFAIIVSAVIIPSAPHTIQSFEGPGYDTTYTLLAGGLVVLLLWETFRLVFIWIQLRTLLMALDRLPLRRGFVGMGFKSRRIWQLGGNTFEDFVAVLSRQRETIAALRNANPTGSEMWAAIHAVLQEVRDFSEWMQKQILAKRRGIAFTNRLVVHLRNLQVALADGCTHLLRDLNREWNLEARPVWDTNGAPREKADCEDAGLPLPVRLAEDFVCLFYFNFVSSVFTRMRALILTIAGIYVFILLSFSSYPFEPTSAFHTLMIFLFLFIAAAVAIVYGQAHKDATISRMTATDPGLGTEFWLRMVSFVSIPLLTLIATKFPEIGGFLFSWLEPASQAFR